VAQREKIGGRYAADLFLRLPAWLSGSVAFAHELVSRLTTGKDHHALVIGFVAARLHLELALLFLGRFAQAATGFGVEDANLSASEAHGHVVVVGKVLIATRRSDEFVVGATGIFGSGMIS
jgi:hypothetical protein